MQFFRLTVKINKKYRKIFTCYKSARRLNVSHTYPIDFRIQRLVPDSEVDFRPLPKLGSDAMNHLVTNPTEDIKDFMMSLFNS